MFIIRSNRSDHSVKILSFAWRCDNNRGEDLVRTAAKIYEISFTLGTLSMTNYIRNVTYTTERVRSVEAPITFFSPFVDKRSPN